MSVDEPPADLSGDQPIEGGQVGELEDLTFEENKHRAETARSLAIWLVVILGASVGLHYVLTAAIVFAGKQDTVKDLNTIFNAWLPAISSLVSAAATYYFTRDKT